MHKKIMAFVLAFAVTYSLLGAGMVRAQGQDSSEALWSVINKLDTAASSIRRGNESSAMASIISAGVDYEENLSSSVASADANLDNEIRQNFVVLSQGGSEPDIFSLRGQVLRAAAMVGVQLPPLFAYSLFIIFAIGVAAAFFVTYVSKRMVNWELVKQNKAKVSEYYKELREAQKKRDMKAIHKVQQRQSEIMNLQKVNTVQNMKPTLIYFVPLMLLWIFLGTIFRGWVVAWLPFIRIDLPFIGSLVTFGVGWWYFITYLGFSQIFRKVIIGD